MDFSKPERKEERETHAGMLRNTLTNEQPLDLIAQPVTLCKRVAFGPFYGSFRMHLAGRLDARWP